MINFKKYKLSDACLKIGSGATPRGGKDVYLASEVMLLTENLDIDHLDKSFIE